MEGTYCAASIGSNLGFRPVTAVDNQGHCRACDQYKAAWLRNARRLRRTRGAGLDCHTRLGFIGIFNDRANKRIVAQTDANPSVVDGGGAEAGRRSMEPPKGNSSWLLEPIIAIALSLLFEVKRQLLAPVIQTFKS